MIKQYGEGTCIICDFCGVKLQFDGNKSGKEAQIALNSQGWVKQGEKVKCAGCQQSRADIPLMIDDISEMLEILQKELEAERELMRKEMVQNAKVQNLEFVTHQENCRYLLQIIKSLEVAHHDLRWL